MSCSLATFLTCFSLSGFYVDGAVIRSNTGQGRMVEDTHLVEGVAFVRPNFGPPIEARYVYEVTEQRLARDADNPYGRVALGYDIELGKRWTTRLEYAYRESVDTGRDEPERSWSLGVTWRPFGRR